MPSPAPFVRPAALEPLAGNSHTTLACIICSTDLYNDRLKQYLIDEFRDGWTADETISVLMLPIDAAALESPAALDSWLVMACNAINKTLDEGEPSE